MEPDLAQPVLVTRSEPFDGEFLHVRIMTHPRGTIRVDPRCGQGARKGTLGL
ncbi:hypothetical protein FHR33_006023 [Nonomuraea dietziae]|uniref:Uncharacterized protein n=1 Tax=Nonomuraea dietziae TaxID=65515 RepID=A0A7W5YD87_9ACTN|nr:hypothetical protein [Nonomuraea dietziae]